MTFSQMQNQVKVLLGDTSDTFFTTTEVSDSLNRIFPEVAAENEVLLTFDDYDVTQSIQRFTLKTAFLTVKRVEYHVSTSRHETLHYLDLDDFHDVGYARANDEGEPVYYKIEMGATETDKDPQRPGDLWLFPIPDITTAAGYPNLRVWYYQMPSTLSTDGSISELPIPLHMVCCYKAASLMAMKMKDPGLHSSLTIMAQRNTEIFKQNSNRPQRDRAFFTKEVMGYDDPQEFF